MKFLSKQLIVSLFIGLMTTSSSELLADEAKSSQLSDEDRSGGYLKLGFGYKAVVNPYQDEEKGKTLFLNGRYQWENGLFVEASFYRVLNTGLNVGYNFYNTEQWNFDVATTIAHGATEVGVFDQGKVFRKKSDITRMLALRATGSFDQTTLQLVVAPYSLNSDYNNGLYASAWLDRSFQFKNWEFYGAVGLEYRSEDMLEYYYGISDEIATEHFTAYEASSGIDITAEVGASYPISKNWLFETYYRYTDLADAMSDSPIMQFTSTLEGRSENMSEFGILVSYVF
jgi:outer membrane protein